MRGVLGGIVVASMVAQIRYLTLVHADFMPSFERSLGRVDVPIRS